jgi:hypothetical protein
MWVETPFSIRTGEIALFAQDGDHFGSPMLINRADNPVVVSPDVAVLMQPGERRERKLRTDGPQMDDWPFSPASGLSVPLKAGHYRFQYMYGKRASADFDVVDATVEGITAREEPDPRADPASRTPPPMRRVQSAQVQAKGQHFIVVSVWRYEKYSGKGPYTLKNVSPFIRLDTWEQQAPHVDVTRRADDVTVATWVGEDGAPKRLEVPPPPGCCKDWVIEVHE